MLMADPPEHTRLRRLVSGAFTTQAVQKLAPRVEELAHELIDRFIEQGSADLVSSFTTPLPITVISELLGVPQDAHSDLLTWTRHATGTPSEQQRTGLLALNTHLRDLIEAKRRDPADDLLSRLIAVRDEECGKLSDVELLGTAVILVVAGHETTVNLLGNAMVALLDDPDQAAVLRRDPKHVPGAIEEFLRYDPPLELTPTRFATADFELGGKPIRAGETVTIALTSAGRDAPVEAGADPDRLDVLRPHPKHVSFGRGIHHCIGAPLARLEGDIALRVLLSRLPDVRWADAAEPVAWLPAPAHRVDDRRLREFPSGRGHHGHTPHR
jgi:cytochrome P450